ncbi:hypothetical protein HNQ60_004076 [Povalibacter uvarum]|uniref:Autotransporter n=1 Tax=Povalibacter uvarum TaxID=732238 RepID=A0A841HQN3_9GAMM|nr:autotransporter [Povalibacter uvarum]MBB6095186.1 hypothetical protein [Povalibacter uvarum]
MVSSLRYLLLIVLCATASVASAAEAPADEAPDVETPWPYEVKEGSTALTVYQPQLDSWDGYHLKARAAVSVKEGDKENATSTYGVIHVTARTLVDKAERIVTLDGYDITKAEFPSAQSKSAGWVKVLEDDAKNRSRTIALDRLEANLHIVQTEKSVSNTPIRNAPPKIIFSEQPALLVYIDGQPAYRSIPGTSYERVINTRPLLVKARSGNHYLHVFDGWMIASSLQGNWTADLNPPSDLKQIKDQAIASRQVDLLTGQSDPEQPAPSLLKGTIPKIVIATEPTELLVTDGAAKWVPIPGTQLLFVENTTGHVFKLLGDQKTYVLISGRWFRAPDIKGPWEYISSDLLAKDFAKIPDDNPKENVKASVARTTQAKEAAIAASIPSTAAVKKAEAKMTPPQFDGEPQLVAIYGTSLQYVVNTAMPIIMVNPNSYYAVENGVWFESRSLQGPWTVATSVPAEIYKIPPSSPLHYVTYVKVYDVVDDTVYVGYTPGYQGQCIDPVTHVVVYGTGYYYTPWIGTYWYGPPVTYGFGVALRYTPWTGWTVGFGFGWAWGAATVAVGWGWGAYPWWGPYGWGWGWGPPMYPIYPAPYWGAAVGPRGAAAWGPGGWAATTGNMYSRWGDVASVSRVSGGYNAWTGNQWASRVGMSYNSSTGVLAAGQRGAVHNVYTGNYATGGRGAATGPGGRTVVGAGGTAGNIYTGDSVSAGKAVVYNKNTGEATGVRGIKGDQGGVIDVGGNVYAGHDGNVWKHTDNGWESVNTDRPQPKPSQTQTRDLNHDRYTRNTGGQRYEYNRGASRSMHRSYGGRRR